MKCPKCGGKLAVRDTITLPEQIVRLRRCPRCYRVYATQELPAPEALYRELACERDHEYRKQAAIDKYKEETK